MELLAVMYAEGQWAEATAGAEGRGSEAAVAVTAGAEGRGVGARATDPTQIAMAGPWVEATVTDAKVVGGAEGREIVVDTSATAVVAAAKGRGAEAIDQIPRAMAGR